MDKVVIRKIFDAHFHFREKKMLKAVLPFIARYCSHAVAMGNLEKPIVTKDQVWGYKNEINSCAINKGFPDFNPVMTVMLTYKMTPEILEESHEAGARVLKLIPGGTSTGSEEGVALWDLLKYHPVLEKAMELGMIFSVHCELNIDPCTETEIPLHKQEVMGIRYFQTMIKEFPDLKIIFEHVSTKELCEYFLKLDSPNVAVTLTGHHPFVDYDQVCLKWDGLNPWLYCKPIAKFAEDIEAVKDLMLSGHPRVFYGSDFAPHPYQDKLIAQPKAGIANIPEVAIPSLWELFLKKHGGAKAAGFFENFTSTNALKFYNLPDNSDCISLIPHEWKVPQMIKGGVKIFKAGEVLNWKIEK